MTNFAVIGAGYWGTKLIGEYLALSSKRNDVNLSAIVDFSTESLSRIKTKFPEAKLDFETDFNEVMKDPKITGVHIAATNEMHYQIASKAIASGKHVLLEKPMSMNTVDAFRLVRQAEKSGSILLIGHIFRFNNAVNKIKEMIETQKIADTRYVELKWSSVLTPLPIRDVIFDLAPHPIDILNHVFEEWPTEVYAKAFSYNRQKFGQEEMAFITLSYPNNILCSVIVSWIDHGPRERSMLISNKNNAIKVEVVDQKMTLYENSFPKELPLDKNNTIEAEITHFADAIKNNDPPINSGLTGAMNVSVLQAIRQSLTENKAIPVLR